MAEIEIKDVTITIKDGTTPTANEIEVTLGEGNFQWTENFPREYRLDRGLLDTVRDADQQPLDLSFEFRWDQITGNTSPSDAPPTVVDALTQTGNASTWETTSDDPCEPYAVDIELFHNVPCDTGNDENETVLFADFRVETLAYDLQAAQISAAGRCNIVQPEVTKSPIT